MTTSTSPSVNYNVDSGSATSVAASNNTYTVSGISATSSLTFQNVNTSNTQLRIKTIVITYEAASSKTATTVTLNHSTLDFDLATPATQTLTASVTETESSSAIGGATVTWTSSDETVATVAGGVVTAKKVGAATITASYAGDETYAASSATCDVTVTNSDTPDPTIVNLTKTGTMTFSSFANAGSYNTTKEETFSVAGSDGNNYTVTKFECQLRSGEAKNLQMRASKGYLILPRITSKKGFTITVTYEITNTASTMPTLKLNSSTVATATGKGDDTYTFSYTTDANSVTGLTLHAGDKATYVHSIVITPTKDTPTVSFSTPTTTLTVDDFVTNAATASNGKAISYVSSDEAVATVDTDGKVTALTVGTTTITASVAADADYNAAEASYELTVTGIPAATDISLTVKNGEDEVIDKDEIPVDEIGTFEATYTKAEGATVSVAYVSSDDTVLEIDGDTYGALKGGSATVTVTITPTDLTRYAETVETFDITVLNAEKGTTTLAIYDEHVEEVTSGSTAYGTPISLSAAVATGYDGTLSYVTTNNAIADVAIDGEDITITPRSVGSATITFTAPETANFEGAVNVDYVLTVTAPDGQTTAPVVEAVVKLNETFAACNGGGGRDGSYSGTLSTGTLSYDGTAWTVNSYVYAAKECIRIGSSSNTGIATTPSLDLDAEKTYTINFNVAGWNTQNESTTLTITASNGTLSPTTITMTKGEWTEQSVTLTGAGSGTTISFQPGKRCFLDDVWVGIPRQAPSIPSVTIAASGYGTYCCQYPLELPADNEDYKAYIVTKADKSSVTFSQISGTIKGGVPFVLFGNAGTYNLTVADESTTVPAGNKLVGTLAPIYVTTVEGDYTNFGLSGGEFKKINEGVIPANKAYLPVLTSALAGEAHLSIIFEDEAAGIGAALNDNGEMTNDKPVYNLAGQRVSKPTKGLYIVGGKKVALR